MTTTHGHVSCRWDPWFWYWQGYWDVQSHVWTLFHTCFSHSLQCWYTVNNKILVDKSNQKNLGTIKSSNLCTEIIKYSAPDKTAVFNLTSLALPSFIINGQYNFQKLHDVAKVVTYNLNHIIDVNYYPIPEAHHSNFCHRPIGLGVQGLADAFMALHMPFDSLEAKGLNI